MFANDELIEKAMEADNFSEAARLSLSVGENNSAYGFFVLGWIFDEGKTGPSDKDMARAYYKRAIDAGSVDANRYLGLLLFEAEEIPQARKAFVSGEDKGDKECTKLILQIDQFENEMDQFENEMEQFENEKLADHLINKKQYKKALRVLNVLAEKNSQYAHLALGFLYQNGFVGRVDIDKARSFYQQAADLGSAEACYHLGWLEADSKEYAAARSAFARGAEAGNLPCMYHLSCLLQKGDGGKTDNKQARVWFEKSARHGHFYSKRELLQEEMKYSNSLIRKPKFYLKLLILAMQFAVEYSKNPESDKVT